MNYVNFQDDVIIVKLTDGRAVSFDVQYDNVDVKKANNVDEITKHYGMGDFTDIHNEIGRGRAVYQLLSLSLEDIDLVKYEYNG